MAIPIDNLDFTSGMSAMGFSYFLEPNSPSVFFSGAVGLGVLQVENFDSESGLGFSLGVGVEFAPNWIIEGTFLNSKVIDDGDYGLSFTHLSLTVSWFAY